MTPETIALVACTLLSGGAISYAVAKVLHVERYETIQPPELLEDVRVTGADDLEGMV